MGHTTARVPATRGHVPRAVLLAVLACLLTSCVTNIGPTLADTGSDDPGPYPSDYETIVRRWIQQEFRFYSRVEGLRVPRPKPGFAKPPLLSLRGTRHGWWTEVSFRAADRLGAPTGTIRYAVLIRDDAVVAQQKLVF